MHEYFIYNKSVSEEVFPDSIVDDINSFRSGINKRTVLPWSEHCTECAVPGCYKTCSLYTPRADGKCNRFPDGILTINSANLQPPHFIKFKFGKWAKYSCQANTKLLNNQTALNKEHKIKQYAGLINKFQDSPLYKPLANFQYSLQKSLSRLNSGQAIPEYFIIEYYNPSATPLDITISVYNDNRKLNNSVFNTRRILFQGYGQVSVPFSGIAEAVTTSLSFRIDITPNNEATTNYIYFGLTEFVTFNSDYNYKPAKVKCVVWDLDNTIWKGILVEDGAENLVLNEITGSLIKELDSKGILNSVSSKNNFEEAKSVLEKFNLWQYFVAPQINWNPKSEGIKTIAEALNINPDTFIFVDDSEFELAEVKKMLPYVKTTLPEYVQLIVHSEGVNQPVTSEASKRREFYQIDVKRKNAQNYHNGNYINFLNETGITIKLSELNTDNFERVNELTQRTNQLNFSGNRYTPEQLHTITANPEIKTFVISCSDKFGEYGIIGFAIFDTKLNRLTDIMFSCRIMGKFVEHRVISYIAENFANKSNFSAIYNKTKRNEQNGKVFDDLGFVKSTEEDNLLILSGNNNYSDYNFIKIIP